MSVQGTSAENVATSDEWGWPQLRCCECGEALVRSDAAFMCSACRRRWPDREGIPSLAETDYYYGKLARERLPELLALAEQGRLREVREAIRDRKGAKVFLRSFDESFADGRFLLPLDQSSDVLDLGCGFGGLTIPIARTCGRIVAVDATLERVAFLARRAAAEGLSNVCALHGDALRLPFATGQFDVVILNGVLEWVGEWDSRDRPRDVQVRALGRVHDLLRPGGVLYLAIENRFAAELLYRRKDHNKLYWTSFMPRPLADLATRALRRKPYRTYTYGVRGYRRLLAESGFAAADFYCPWPRYQAPDYILRWGDRPGARYFHRTILRQEHYVESLLFRLLALAGLDWAMAPAFIMIARKP